MESSEAGEGEANDESNDKGGKGRGEERDDQTDGGVPPDALAPLLLVHHPRIPNVGFNDLRTFNHRPPLMD